MKAAATFVVLVATVLLPTRHAAGYALLGTGSASCEAWTAARGGSSHVAQEQWVVGFLSGVGSMVLGELDPLRGMTPDAVYLWLDGYCRDHPAETIEASARVFVRDHPR